MSIRVGINGFGRIGRNVVRANWADGVDFVAVNDVTDANTLAHLLKYDSVHGRMAVQVRADDDAIRVAGSRIRVLSEPDPARLPWKELGVDVVLECSGLFTSREKAAVHLQGGAKKVIISAPARGADLTVCYGVNHLTYTTDRHHVISNASCTTNCLAPVAKVLNDNFGIKHALMNTVHAYTNDQRILDTPHEDLRRARALALSMIPTTTGATHAVVEVLPELRGKIDGMAVRVPTPNVSLIDLTADLAKSTSVDEINQAMKDATEGPLKGVLAYCDEELVSIDFNGSPYSSIFDAPSTKVLDGSFVKVLAWYDNEWGFSRRMGDVARFIGSQL
ncbi:MAG TPA: type I glyceraldehyde-3-phosphate dehydrogenase [Candidatus Acidoferrales bacterium]|nr:type I glyceraldehyde-3-phosphate dehydrogenase [Candidatus Acidoferrales bacterium]